MQSPVKHTWSWYLPAADTYFASHLTARGFEIDKLDKALSYVDNFRLAIDGGAHIGTWAIYMAKRFNEVVAFEPAKDSYQCLIKNKEMCGIKNIVALDIALGESSGWGMMSDDGGNTGSRWVTIHGGNIPIRSIDSFDYQIMDFIKLDVEGSELAALNGAVQTIKRCKPIALVECRDDREAIIKFMDDIGYKELGGIKEDRVFGPR